MTDETPPTDEPTPPLPPVPLVFICQTCGDAVNFSPTLGWRHTNGRRDHQVVPAPPGTPLNPGGGGGSQGGEG